MPRRRGRELGRSRPRVGRRPFGIETLESRYALDGAGPRPFIDLGPSDNVALDQPRVTVEFGDAQGQSIGPDIFNSWLLDTGANTILVFKTGVDDMNESPPPYQVEGVFEEIGVGGSQLFDISAPYQFDFAGTGGVRQTLPETRVISDATRDVSMFGPFGIVGMPAMTERVTTLDFTPWLTFAEGNFLMAADFAAEVPAPAGPRYSVSVDDRVSFSPDGHVLEGDHPPVWADIPFFTAEVHHGGKAVAGNFMFDTGAQVTIISSATALALGLDSNGDGTLDAQDVGYTRSETVGGVGGSRDSPVFMIDSVHVPTDQGVDLVWTSLLWLVADIAPGIDGVFGFDNMTSGWIDATFSSGGAGSILKSHLDFRGWESTGTGKIHFELNPELAAVQNPEGAGARIVEPGGVTTVSETGIEDSYTISLTQRPTADVVVELVAPANKLIAFPASAPQATSLRFTPDDWDLPQRVVVRAVDDSTEQSLHRSSVRHVSSSADPAYQGVGMPRVLVNIVDDDYPAVMILPSDGQTDVVEGGVSDTYGLVLMKQPTEDVTIVLEPADGQVVATSDADGTTALVFTPSNWNQPQSVRVTAVDDTLVEGPRRSWVNHRISSADEAYGEAYALAEIIFVTDDDTPAANPPTIAAAAATLLGTTGETLVNSGTWGHPDSGRTVTLSASLGAVVRQEGGVWTWSHETGAPLGDAPVTITAIDDLGRIAATTFTVTARGFPSGLVATGGDRGATLEWSAPPTVPGLPITAYAIEASSDAGVSWHALPDTTSDAATAVITGLTNGLSYSFRVAARDARGVGPWSAASPAIVPMAVPGTPLEPVANAGDAMATLTWTAPSDTGGSVVIDYAVQSSVDDGTTWIDQSDTVSTATSLEITGLANGVSHRFRVAALNAVGRGAWSVASDPVTPVGPPGAASGVVATPGNGQAGLSWTAPAFDGGSVVIDYAVQSSVDGGTTWQAVPRLPSAATSAVVTGLVNGKGYLFRVAALNAIGSGGFAATAAAAIPALPAGVPTALKATRGDGSATLVWKAPAANGGSAIVDYAIQVSADGGTNWQAVARAASASTGATVSGLTNGGSYVFRVAAVNSVGSAAFTPKSAAVVPATTAGAVSAVVGTRRSGQIGLSWSAPQSNGGFPITDYVVQSSVDGGRTWRTFPHKPSPATAISVTGLVNGTPYLFRVAAVNGIGRGGFAATSTALVPATVAGPPTGLRTGRGDAVVTLSWKAPVATGGVAIGDYTIQSSTDGGKTWATILRAASTAVTATIGGLPLGVPHVFRVAAVNEVGAGAFTAKSAVVVPATLPGAPDALQVVAAASRATLSWKVPSATGGTAIIDYLLEWSVDGGTTWKTVIRKPSAATSAAVTGLPAGVPWAFRVSARNAIGTGPVTVFMPT